MILKQTVTFAVVLSLVVLPVRPALAWPDGNAVANEGQPARAFEVRVPLPGLAIKVALPVFFAGNMATVLGFMYFASKLISEANGREREADALIFSTLGGIFVLGMSFLSFLMWASVKNFPQYAALQTENFTKLRKVMNDLIADSGERESEWNFGYRISDFRSEVDRQLVQGGPIKVFLESEAGRAWAVEFRAAVKEMTRNLNLLHASSVSFSEAYACSNLIGWHALGIPIPKRD